MQGTGDAQVLHGVRTWHTHFMHALPGPSMAPGHVVTPTPTSTPSPPHPPTHPIPIPLADTPLPDPAAPPGALDSQCTCLAAGDAPCHQALDGPASCAMVLFWCLILLLSQLCRTQFICVPSGVWSACGLCWASNCLLWWARGCKLCVRTLLGRAPPGPQSDALAAPLCARGTSGPVWRAPGLQWVSPALCGVQQACSGHNSRLCAVCTGPAWDNWPVHSAQRCPRMWGAEDRAEGFSGQVKVELCRHHPPKRPVSLKIGLQIGGGYCPYRYLGARQDTQRCPGVGKYCS